MHRYLWRVKPEDSVRKPPPLLTGKKGEWKRTRPDTRLRTSLVPYRWAKPRLTGAGDGECSVVYRLSYDDTRPVCNSGYFCPGQGPKYRESLLTWWITILTSACNRGPTVKTKEEREKKKKEKEKKNEEEEKKKSPFPASRCLLERTTKTKQWQQTDI